MSNQFRVMLRRMGKWKRKSNRKARKAAMGRSHQDYKAIRELLRRDKAGVREPIKK